MQHVGKGRANNSKRRSSRARSAPLEQMNLNAAGIDVGSDRPLGGRAPGSR